MCGVVRGGIVPGLWGYEAGQSGVGDIFALVRRARGPAALPRGGARARPGPARLPVRARRRAGGRRARADRARLAQRQPLRARRPRAQRPDRRPDAGHARGGHLPRADRGDRIRHARRSSTAFADAGVPVSELVRRRRADQEPGDHADLRRRDPDAAAPDRLRPGSGARLGDARRGRGRACTRTSRRRPRRWAALGATRTCRTRRAPTPTTRSTSTTCACTTTSGAAATTSCTACATLRPRELAHG